MIRIAPPVARALSGRSALVALESTLIAHGLPAPLNVETARSAEAAVLAEGATPATIGIVAGVPVIGLSPEEIEVFGRRTGILKTNTSNLAWVITRQAWGSTTVSASLALARRAGINVFATGGIGGVHRNVAETFDISSDLDALAQTPLVVVCSGAKSILDIAKTFEVLETRGVPVVGFRCHEVPAFFSRQSGVPVETTVDSPAEVAVLAEVHRRLGQASALLVVVPPPENAALPKHEIDLAIEQSLEEAARQGIAGRALTPYLLESVNRLSGGRSLAANVALIENNARVAAAIAVAWSRRNAPDKEDQ